MKPTIAVGDARLELAIESAADSLLSICAVATGLDAEKAMKRACLALATVVERAREEHLR